MSDIRDQRSAIEQKVAPLIGKEAWGAALGVGSFVTIEFGAPQPAASGQEKQHGEWHLWVYCCAWRLATDEEILAASEDPRPALESAVSRLNGRTLRAVTVEPPALETTFYFDGGLNLRLFPLFSADYEHWMLFDPTGHVLTIGPGSGWSYETASRR